MIELPLRAGKILLRLIVAVGDPAAHDRLGVGKAAQFRQQSPDIFANARGDEPAFIDGREVCHERLGDLDGRGELGDGLFLPARAPFVVADIIPQFRPMQASIRGRRQLGVAFGRVAPGSTAHFERRRRGARRRLASWRDRCGS